MIYLVLSIVSFFVCLIIISYMFLKNSDLKCDLKQSKNDFSFLQKRLDLLKDDLSFYKTSLTALGDLNSRLTKNNNELKTQISKSSNKQFVEIAGTMLNVDEIQQIELNTTRKNAEGKTENCLKIWFKHANDNCSYRYYTNECKEQATKDIQKLLEIKKF